jgi:hypothetical protein
MTLGESHYEAFDSNDQAITAWNTRQPRFSEIEKKSLELVCGAAKTAVNAFERDASKETEHSRMGKSAIATVRKMLSDTPKQEQPLHDEAAYMDQLKSGG